MVSSYRLGISLPARTLLPGLRKLRRVAEARGRSWATDIPSHLADFQAEFYPLRAQLEGRAYHGREGLRRFIVELAEEFDGVHFDVGEIRDLGERLVGFGRFRARGNASGVEIDVPLGMVGVMREKKVVYARFFSDPAEALEAAGLRE